MSKDTKLTDAEIALKREALKKAQADAELLKSELGEEVTGDTEVTESDLEKSLTKLSDVAKDSLEKCDTGTKDKKDKKDDDEPEGTAKSFADHLDDDEGASEVVEVSPFLAGIADSIAKSMDGLTSSYDDIKKALKASAEFGVALTDVVKAQSAEIADLKKSITDIERLPGVRKAELDGDAVDRELGSGDKPSTKLTKAQVGHALEDMAMKGDVDSIAVTMFSQSGEIAKADVAKVEAYYKQ